AAAAQAHAAVADRFVAQARAVDSSVPSSGSNSSLVLDNLVATALNNRAAARAADAEAAAAAAAAARAHAFVFALIPDTDPDPTSTRNRARYRLNTANNRARTAATLAAAARAIAVAADRAVDQARDVGNSVPNPGYGSVSDHTLDSLVAAALARHEDARLADARARAAAAVAARAHAAVPLSNTDPNFVRAFARARAADSRAHTAAALAAAARVAAIDADRVFAQARAADGRAPDLGPDSNLVIASVGAAATAATCSVSVTSTTDTSTAAIAGSSTSSLLPDTSSPVPSGFVELFGFVVPTELSEVVSKLISEVCALAKSFYPGTLRVPFSGAVRSLSNSEQRCAWCLT
ncbi:hypothetical protein, partial [Candidatus Ichthyocystis sparus]|uniref:hypothetical protein n=1 Tax=Candidatus Ichthyocystis sparus TaxID=1561004 RepID=UPI001F5E7931